MHRNTEFQDRQPGDRATFSSVIVPPQNAPSGIALLAIDVDGTLVTEANQVLPGTREAVRRAQGGGLEVVLATGRRYRTTQRVMEQLGLSLPAVCLGGALTKSAAGETLHSEPFAAKEVDALLRHARGRGLPLILQRDSDGRGGPDFVVDAGVPWNEETEYYVRVGGESGSTDRAPERTGYDDILVVGAFGSREELAGLERDFIGDGAFATVLVPSKRTPGWYLETILGHVSKWTGLQRLAAHSGVSESAVCAVGDAANDLPMIRSAGFGVAMGNASPEVKEAADWVTGSNDEGGLVPLIELLVNAASSR